MNVIQQLAVKEKPELVFFVREPMVMSALDREYLPTLLSKSLNIAIQEVEPVCHVGSVLVFNVTPKKNPDPRLVYCLKTDLKWYYHIWVSVIEEGAWMDRDEKSKMRQWFDDELKRLIVDKLQEDEASFLILELMRFRNEHLFI